MDKYERISKEFYNKYTQEIKPLIDNYEKERKKKLAFIIFVDLVIVLSILFLFGSILSNITLYISFVLLLICIIYNLIYIGSFESRVKTSIFKDICKYFEDLFCDENAFKEQYKKDNYQQRKIQYEQSKLFDDFKNRDLDIINIYDIFSGKIKGQPLEIIRCYLSQIRRYHKTYFDGIIINIKTKEKFIGHTILHPTTVIIKKQKDLKKLNRPNLEFTKLYNIYTNNENETLKILTSALLEKIKNIKTNLIQKSVSYAFYDNFITIAILSEKFESCSIFKPINSNKYIFNIFEKLLAIVKLIDEITAEIE